MPSGGLAPPSTADTGVNLPIAATARASVRALWAVVRSRSARLTLDQLRSDLSHETAAKIARLTGFIQEWRLGRFQPGDPGDIEAILRDLERILLRHARLAGGRFGTFALLIRLLSVLGAMRTDLRAPRGQAAPLPGTIERFAGLVARLKSGSLALVESLSARYGERFGDLLGAATEEIRRESGDGRPHDISVVLQGARDGASTWVPRRDAAPWADVLRNLIRNAVQATADRGQAAPAGSPGADTVTVRVLPLPGRPGVAVEVLDEGVGMDPEALEAMWRAGRSTHGLQRGNGLTESKRAFVESRATLEVRSAVGVGTCVRIELQHGDVPIRSQRLWVTPPVVAPLLAVLAGLTLGLSPLLQPPIVDAELDEMNNCLLRAHDARGAVVWERDLGEAVRPNYLGSAFSAANEWVTVNRHLVLPARWPQASGVVVATKPSQGPGHLWRLGAGGRTVWKRTLRWMPPRTPHLGYLTCVFQVLTPWNDGRRQAMALNVRDVDWGSTAIQFFTPDGDSLGAYHHPGHLEYQTSADLDGDGRVELILTGRNNRAREQRDFLPEDPGEDYIECILMLEPPDVNGQAYPYNGWVGMPHANEEGYLLIPPLRKGPRVIGESPVICKTDFSVATAPGTARVELATKDGRIFELDGHLRPLSCGVGDRTFADSLAPTRALGPLLYIYRGRLEFIDLPVQRGP